MKYFAINQQTVEWMLTRTSLIQSVYELIFSENILEKLRDSEISEGSLRVSGSSDSRVICLWNIDYLTNAGGEEWGFIKLEDPLGILSFDNIGREVFERCLYVINQRLQGLLIDQTTIHKSYASGSHSCLAGRGDDARQLSIGFFESDAEGSSGRRRSIVCVGPSRSYDAVNTHAAHNGLFLKELCKISDDIVSPLKRRPVLNSSLFPELRDSLLPKHEVSSDYDDISANIIAVDGGMKFHGLDWSYDQWVDPSSLLSSIQRRILLSNGIKRHPIRIIGPAGSGKTLLMMLIALKLIKESNENNEDIKILYVAHNAKMADRVRERFSILGGDDLFEKVNGGLVVETLNSYVRNYLQISEGVVIDKDAGKTKDFQLQEVKQALRDTINSNKDVISSSKIFFQSLSDGEVFEALSWLIMSEISLGIKAHGLNYDRKRYVESERNLSRFHGVLTKIERGIVFSVFEKYHNVVFDHYGVLDSDDIALELLSRLRAPVRQLKRKSEGFDYVFVDETQLFNENERRIFPLLTKGIGRHVPIALALDEAQEPYGQSSSGLALLGFDQIESEILPDTHRSTKDIIDLCFFILQKTTDLFTREFPDYTAIGKHAQNDTKNLAAPPIALWCNEDTKNLGKFVIKRIRSLRKENIRQIAVVCHTDLYWRDILDELNKSDLPLFVIEQRGQYIPQSHPVVVLSRPHYIGGQEFDAVIAIGLEQGVYPARIRDNDPLAVTLEQQALREMYLSFSRSRYRLIVVLSHGSRPNSVLQDAMHAKLLRQ